MEDALTDPATDEQAPDVFARLATMGALAEPEDEDWWK